MKKIRGFRWRSRLKAAKLFYPIESYHALDYALYAYHKLSLAQPFYSTKHLISN